VKKKNKNNRKKKKIERQSVCKQTNKHVKEERDWVRGSIILAKKRAIDIQSPLSHPSFSLLNAI
jgi:hypothetical protein